MTLPAHLRADLAQRYVKLDPAGRVDDDIPCDKCAYNLRTLRTDAACPECNTPVVDSLYWRCEKRVRSAWLLRLSWGVLAIAITVILVAAFGNGRHPPGVVAAMLLLVFGGAGIWLSTLRAPLQQESASDSVIRFAARWLTLATWPAILAAALNCIPDMRIVTTVVMLLPLSCMLVCICLIAALRDTPWFMLRICLHALAALLGLLEVFGIHDLLVNLMILRRPIMASPFEWLRPLLIAIGFLGVAIAIWLTVRYQLKAAELRRDL